MLLFLEFLIRIPSYYTSRGRSKIQSSGKWLKGHYQMKSNVWQSVFNLKLWLHSICSLLYQQKQMFFWGIIINIAPNLGSISVHKSLDIIKSTSIAKNITSDGLFLKAALDLWFKPSNFVPGVIARPEWMINPIFSINIPVCSSKRTLVFSGSFQW